MKPPRLSRHGWRYVFTRATREFWLGGGPDIAATLTFFTLLSTAPTILAVYSIATLVLANNAPLVSELAADFIAAYIPAEYETTVADLVHSVIGTSAGGVIGLTVGTVIALWSASAYVRAFSRSSNRVYGQAEGRPLIRKSATMLATTLFLVLGLVVILASVMLNETVVKATLGPVAEPLGMLNVLEYLLGVFLPVWRWLKWPIIIGLAVGLIDVLYYVAPNIRRERFRWLSVGAAVALTGLALVSAGFYLYLAYFTALNSYGAIGTVMALMFAMWGGNTALVLGLKIDAEVERARQLRSGVPAERDMRFQPRSTRRSDRNEAARERMEERGRDLRMRYLED